MTAALAPQRAATNRRRSGSARSRAGSSPRRQAVSKPKAVSSRANMVRPQLKVLDQQALRLRARRRNVAMTMFMVLIVGFFAAALAQAQLVANQHELDGLRTQVAEADATRARLERAVEEASAPEAIINGAGELGMVRSNEPAYLVAVSDAPSIDVISVLGSTTAATGSAVAQTDPAGDEIMVAAPATADRTLVGPAVAGIAGARAVATGIGTG